MADSDLWMYIAFGLMGLVAILIVLLIVIGCAYCKRRRRSHGKRTLSDDNIDISKYVFNGSGIAASADAPRNSMVGGNMAMKSFSQEPPPRKAAAPSTPVVGHTEKGDKGESLGEASADESERTQYPIIVEPYHAVGISRGPEVHISRRGTGGSTSSTDPLLSPELAKTLGSAPPAPRTSRVDMHEMAPGVRRHPALDEKVESHAPSADFLRSSSQQHGSASDRLAAAAPTTLPSWCEVDEDEAEIFIFDGVVEHDAPQQLAGTPVRSSTRQRQQSADSKPTTPGSARRGHTRQPTMSTPELDKLTSTPLKLTADAPLASSTPRLQSLQQPQPQRSPRPTRAGVGDQRSAVVTTAAKPADSPPGRARFDHRLSRPRADSLGAKQIAADIMAMTSPRGLTSASNATTPGGPSADVTRSPSTLTTSSLQSRQLADQQLVASAAPGTPLQLSMGGVGGGGGKGNPLSSSLPLCKPATAAVGVDERRGEIPTPSVLRTPRATQQSDPSLSFATPVSAVGKTAPLDRDFVAKLTNTSTSNGSKPEKNRATTTAAAPPAAAAADSNHALATATAANAVTQRAPEPRQPSRQWANLPDEPQMSQFLSGGTDAEPLESPYMIPMDNLPAEFAGMDEEHIYEIIRSRRESLRGRQPPGSAKAWASGGAAQHSPRALQSRRGTRPMLPTLDSVSSSSVATPAVIPGREMYRASTLYDQVQVTDQHLLRFDRQPPGSSNA